MKKTVSFSVSRVISIILSLAVLVSCAGVIPPAVTASAESLDEPVIVNAGFETGAASPWQLGGNSQVVAGGRDGSAYALKVAGVAWTHVKQQISVSPNTDYRITGWVKRVSGTGAHYLYAKGPTDQPIAAINGTRQYFTYMDSDWVMHKWEFNSGSFTTINIDMVIEDPDSVFLYDDISIKELLPSSFDGYIYNGNFETGDYNPWSIKSPAAIVAGGRDGSDYAFRMEGGQWSSASQNVEVEPHTDYRLTGWVKRVSGTGAHYLYAKDQNGGNISAINGTKQWFNQTTTDWVEHVWEFNSGTFSYIKVYITVEDPNSVFLYDDIKLEKLCTASFDGYITNGDLETGSAGGWDLNDGTSVVTGGYNSGYALKVGGSAGTAVTQNVKVEGLTDYRLTVRIKRISGRGAHSILAKKGDAVLENINGTDGKITFTDRKWHEQSIEFNSGRTAVVTVCLNVDTASSVFLYDNITLEKIGAVDYSGVQKGDVTLDSAVDEADLALAVSAVKGGTQLEGAAEYAADMNCDGRVNEDDVSLLRAYLNNGSAPVLLYPTRGETVANASWQIDELLTNYRPGKSDEYSGIGSRPDQYARDEVVLRWMPAAGAVEYTVLLADNPALTGAKTYTVSEPTLSVQNLMVNTDYYWAVEVGGERSDTGTFHTADTVRTLWIEGVSNTRDIGGWKTADGTQRVKYGIAYRGAKFDDFTEAGKQAIIDLGIKTDVDLRGNNEGVNEPLKKLGVTWYLAGYYGCAMYNGTDSTSIERIGSNHVNGTINALRAYANPANYPAYFHCSYGRDRTGTLGLLLLGLLGVSKVDVQKDYEMTFLSEWGGGGLSAEGHVSLLNRTISWIQTNYAQGGTLQESIEAYVLAAGLSAGEIAAIRANMLEPVPEETAVTGIEIASVPDKTEYYAGDLLDPAGGELSVAFSDGTVKTVKMSIDMIGGFDRNAAGVQTLTVTYEGFTAQFEVTVVETVIRGDMDGDGEITVSDALVALRIAARLAEETPEAIAIGDADGDGAITVSDALRILRVAAKLADTL